MDPARSQDDRLDQVVALGEPLRRRLYLFVASQPDAVSRDQAAQEFGVSRSVAAFHLDRLAELGLVDVEFRRPPGRAGPGAGRPSKLYRGTAHDVAVSLPPRDYEVAGRLLAEAVSVSARDGVPVTTALSDAARTVGVSLGRRAHEDATSSAPEDVVDAACEVLRDCAYEARRAEGDIVLDNCPFHALAEGYRDLVCGMNLALMNGFTEALLEAGLDAELDPQPGRCCVVLRKAGTRT
jgi:predicted ArsR family transcriptional regulator